MAAARPMTLQDRVLQIDHIQARRFSKLSGETLEIATEGIIRHLRACVRMDVNPDASAVREIIDDSEVRADADALPLGYAKLHHLQPKVLPLGLTGMLPLCHRHKPVLRLGNGREPTLFQ